MGLRDDGSQGSSLSLPGQHLILNLANLLLEVPGLGRDGLPDGGVPHPALALPGSAESVLACRGDVHLVNTWAPYLPFRALM